MLLGGAGTIKGGAAEGKGIRRKPYISNSERFHLSRKATSLFCWGGVLVGDLGGGGRGRGGHGGSPILAIEKDHTSQQRQQAISVGGWEWKEIWGGGGGGKGGAHIGQGGPEGGR